MPDFMTATMPEPEPGMPGGVEIVKTTVIRDKMDSARMSVRFIVAADSPSVAYGFAQDSALINEGLRLVRKEGLLSPGVTGSAIPVACNENGESSANPMGTIDPNAKRKYCYSITYEYLGED